MFFLSSYDHFQRKLIIIAKSQGFFPWLFSLSWEQRKLSDLVERGSTFGAEKELPRVEYEDIISGTGNLNKDIYTKVSNKAGL